MIVMNFGVACFCFILLHLNMRRNTLQFIVSLVGIFVQVFLDVLNLVFWFCAVQSISEFVVDIFRGRSLLCFWLIDCNAFSHLSNGFYLELIFHVFPSTIFLYLRDGFTVLELLCIVTVSFTLSRIYLFFLSTWTLLFFPLFLEFFSYFLVLEQIVFFKFCPFLGAYKVDLVFCLGFYYFLENRFVEN